ncbi:MAG: monovalent cation/H+ antiporter complex subunit F [Candidatus Nezhaarchaeota archaeon]|nr:monovalent cation/H+ antiporter complex subunit F [Candidatus Nezhaarchaeota archaeon]
MEELVKTVILFLIPVFGVSVILYSVRVARGPTIPDMALAVDCLSYDVCFLMALLAVYFEAPFLVVCAICLALWAYMFDLYMAKYLEKKELGE